MTKANSMNRFTFRRATFHVSCCIVHCWIYVASNVSLFPSFKPANKCKY